jgi:HAD superfamily hydrolase (TIGR01549 family)
VNILWDFDGTLFDTYPVYTRLLKQILPSSVKEDEIYNKLKTSANTAFTYFQMTHEQIHHYHQLVRACPVESFKPFSFVEKVLSAANKNVIMTHKSRDTLDKILNYYGMEKYFNELVTKDDNFPRKPDPAAYIYLDAHQGFDLAIGDRTLDIIPAKKLGKKTCLFQNDAPGADFYLSSYDEFFERVRL